MMKISKETIDILVNFYSINKSIVLRAGSVITTQRQDVIVARADVAETFPRTIPIVDLKKFLNLLTLGDGDPDVTFGDECIIIKQGDFEVKYAYSPEGLIDAPPDGKKIKLRSKDVQFTLKDEVWQQVHKAMGIMSFTEFAFVGDNGKLSIQALSTRIENGMSDTYSANLGQTDKTFNCIMSLGNMKMIPGDYDVTIDRNGLVHFKGEVAEYWVIMSAKSTFE